MLFQSTYSQSFLVVRYLYSNRIGLVTKVPLTGCQCLRGTITMQEDNLHKTISYDLSAKTKKHQCITKQHRDSFSICKFFKSCPTTALSFSEVWGSTVLGALHRTQYRWKGNLFASKICSCTCELRWKQATVQIAQTKLDTSLSQRIQKYDNCAVGNKQSEIKIQSIHFSNRQLAFSKSLLSVISCVWKTPISNKEVKSLYLHVSEFTHPKGYMPFK